MVGRLDYVLKKLIDRLPGTRKSAHLRRLFRASVAVLTLAGCSSGKVAESSTADSAHTTTPLDSILPMDEAIRRFREGLPEVAGLRGGETSRDALIEAFVDAVAANDTSAVQGLLVSRTEYAYLYFPSSIYMNKPYQQAPALAWFLNVQSGEKGISRVMRRLGGQELAMESYSCGEPSREGTNTFWRSCTLTYRDRLENAPVTRRLFGTIMERDGRYKFLSYANDL